MKRMTSACAFLFLLFSAPVFANTISVHQNDNLQNILNNVAKPGDTLILDAGATFNGTITLPNKGGTSFITIQSSGVSSLPDGQGVKPSDVSHMATIISPPLQPALKTAEGASFYKLIGIEFTFPDQDGLPTNDGLSVFDIVRF